MKTLAHFRDFEPGQQAGDLPEGWTTWAAREEIAPRFSVDANADGTGQRALCIACDDQPEQWGAWHATVEGIIGGNTYRLIAFYRARSVANERRSIAARLDWLDAQGNRARPPDHAFDTGEENGWTCVEYVATAPENAVSVRIELSLGWAAKGVVWWNAIQLREEPEPPHRIVRAMTVFLRPEGMGTASKNVEAFCRVVENAATQKPDLVCFPEGMTQVRTGKSYIEASETVPGPTTQRLGELARQLRAYIVAGLYERVENIVYNTAVLIGRQGELLGTYRKTHLPREEVEGGLTPGDCYPVFETDFGKIGLLICWDVQFPEPARALALQGAEIILLPIAGGSEILARARAIENHIFLITSSYDMKTFIVDPTGDILAEATAEQPVAVAQLDLDRKYLQYWLGDMKARTWKERRADMPLPGWEVR